MGPEQDALKLKVDRVRILNPPDIKTSEPRSGIAIETEIKKLMVEYLDYCNRSNTLSFQGSMSEMAWEVENDPED